jgi:putative NADPH-quinone reductase
MAKHITIIQGHPDSDSRHFGHALADEYANGARDSRHEVRKVEVAQLAFPLLRTKQDFEKGTPPANLKEAVEAIKWADHLVIVYPLWLGSMPALLKAFFEQVFRPGIAFDYRSGGKMPKKLLTGKSARVIVTMGMPSFVYRWFFFAHSVKSLQRNILKFCGVSPVKATLIGNIEGMRCEQRTSWLDKVRRLGGKSR